MRLSAERIAAARAIIDPALLGTPVVRATLYGHDALLKDETANRLGCFKGRGADYFVANLSHPRELVCASAGNFGLALADAGRRRGHRVTVFVSRHANPSKVARIREAGGEVIVAGDDFDAAKAAARARVDGLDHRDEVTFVDGDDIDAAAAGVQTAELGPRGEAMYVEDGEIVAISEGAGTIAAELDEVDLVLVPVGNGALIAGIGTWLRAHHPQTRVIGVCAAGAPVMHASWHGRRVAEATARVETIADGIAVRVPVPAAVEDLAHVVDDMLLVDDDALRAAMAALHAATGITAEPSAVAGIAALASHRFPGRIATILTGANL